MDTADLGPARTQADTSAEPLPQAVAPGSAPGDVVALAAALALITIAALVGRQLQARGQPIVLASAPLLAYLRPPAGWGTPLSALCVLTGLLLQRVTQVARWRLLLLAGWLLNFTRMCRLTFMDGMHRGWINVLQNPNEYLHHLPRIHDPATFVSTFTHFIAFGPGVTRGRGLDHPRGRTPSAGPLGVLAACPPRTERRLLGRCPVHRSVVGGQRGPAAHRRELGAEAAARRLVPFIALFPGAVWMAVSADGLFAGVACGGLALVTMGAVRRRLLASLAGGALLGAAAVFLSYRLVLFGVVVLVTVCLTVRRHGWRHSGPPWLIAAAGALLVAPAHLVYGFNWFVGLAQLRVRYYQSISSTRPFSYFVYANIAASLVSCSPVVAVGVSAMPPDAGLSRPSAADQGPGRRPAGALRRSRRGPRRPVCSVQGRDRTHLAGVRAGDVLRSIPAPRPAGSVGAGGRLGFGAARQSCVPHWLVTGGAVRMAATAY